MFKNLSRLYFKRILSSHSFRQRKLIDRLPVGEVHPGDVHAVLDELEEGLRGSRHGSDGADDSGQTHPTNLSDINFFYLNSTSTNDFHLKIYTAEYALTDRCSVCIYSYYAQM